MNEFLDFSQTGSVVNHCYGTFTTPRGPCPYCGNELNKRYDEYGNTYHDFPEQFTWESYACTICGWWWCGTLPDRTYFVGSTVMGTLHRTPQVPQAIADGFDEVRRHSTKLFVMDPTKFELFVADLFRSFYDCEVVHCGKSHDGGIDLILIESNGGIIPVQVKRRSRQNATESVSVVREFRGALLLAGRARGKVVTTAQKFSKEAREISDPTPEHSLDQWVDLVDCRRLLNILDVVCAKKDRVYDACHRYVLNPIPAPEVEAKVLGQLRLYAEQTAA